MQKMKERMGSSRVDSALRYVGIRLKSRPETVAMGEEVDAVRQKLREADDAYLMAFERRVGATAEIDYLDTRVDKTVMQLAREVLVRTQNDRNDPRYKLLFPVAPSTMMQAKGGDVQDRAVRAIIATLESEFSLAELRPYAQTLREHADKLSQAMAARQELYAPEQVTLAKRTVVMDEARRLYNLLPSRLTVLFPNDPAFVESCFRDLYVRGDVEVSEPEVAAAV